MPVDSEMVPLDWDPVGIGELQYCFLLLPVNIDVVYDTIFPILLLCDKHATCDSKKYFLVP